MLHPHRKPGWYLHEAESMGNALALKESHWVRECTHKQGGFTWLTIPPVGGMQISEDKAPKQPSAPSIDTAASPTQP